MENKGKVTIWIGKFDSESDLKQYIKEEFTEEGDVFSKFMRDFKIDYIDNQFQEVLFKEDQLNKEDLFSQFSYSETFIEKIPENDWVNINSILCVYDFDYNDSQNNFETLNLLGVFDYNSN